MSQDQDYNPLCLCGHPWNEHYNWRQGDNCQVKKCECLRCRLPEEEQA